jgi:hypothetical protein
MAQIINFYQKSKKELSEREHKKRDRIETVTSHGYKFVVAKKGSKIVLLTNPELKGCSSDHLWAYRCALADLSALIDEMTWGC